MRDLESLKRLFEEYLSAQVFPTKPENLYAPNAYFLQIGGKRLRPTLLLLACEIYNQKAENALDAAIAVEYFHNFSLIHDDVMDNASVRRGFETIHEKYGLNTAILSGDVLLTYAYAYLAKVSHQHALPVWDTFNKTAIQVCEGQQMDMDFEKMVTTTEEDYLKMIEYKTSVLVAASMKIGAIIGGATEEEAESMYNYGLQVGMAFQIQDDILDCYGSSEMVGKKIGGDIVRNKKTLLNIKTAQTCTEKGDYRLNDIYNKKDIDLNEKVSAVLELYNEYGVKQYAEQIRDQKVVQANISLEQLNISIENKKMLSTLGNHLVYRSF